MKAIQKVAVVMAVLGLTLMGTATAALADHSVYLGSPLSGAFEVGNAGDPDGTGSAAITIVNASGEICFDIDVTGIDTPTAAHIHSGGFGTNGGVVVNLDYAANGPSGCVTAPIEMRRAIENTPTLFYVNVHNEAFPAGAVRGQLEVVPAPAAPVGGGAQELAFTGSNLTGMLAVAGGALIAGGALLVRTSRRED